MCLFADVVTNIVRNACCFSPADHGQHSRQPSPIPAELSLPSALGHRAAAGNRPHSHRQLPIATATIWWSNCQSAITSIEVTAKGFQKYVQEGITLDVNESGDRARSSRGLDRRPSKSKSTPTRLSIQNTVSSLGKTVMEREILDLPLDGRDFAQLGVLQPGVVPLTPGLLEAGGGLRDSAGLCGRRAASGVE